VWIAQQLAEKESYLLMVRYWMILLRTTAQVFTETRVDFGRNLRDEGLRRRDIN
jgi:hypothetical protein